MKGYLIMILFKWQEYERFIFGKFILNPEW
jgi:hypothetical protein